MRLSRFRILAACAFALAGSAAGAETPADFLARFEAEARRTSPTFAASAERGAQFFQATHGNDWSCATCHTKNPTARGKHAKTGKIIEPMAPTANRERLSRAKTVDKWFARNCKDVLGRVCTPAEKADVVAWLASITH